MPPRLLSILSLVESALGTLECPSVQRPATRVVNFQKGLAKMSLADGSGWILVQNFVLADGEICIRADFGWANTQETGTCSIFPKGDNFDWFGAAAKVAEAWMAGPKLPVSAGLASETLPAAS